MVPGHAKHLKCQKRTNTLLVECKVQRSADTKFRDCMAFFIHMSRNLRLPYYNFSYGVTGFVMGRELLGGNFIIIIIIIIHRNLTGPITGHWVRGACIQKVTHR